MLASARYSSARTCSWRYQELGRMVLKTSTRSTCAYRARRSGRQAGVCVAQAAASVTREAGGGGDGGDGAPPRPTSLGDSGADSDPHAQLRQVLFWRCSLTETYCTFEINSVLSKLFSAAGDEGCHL